MPSSGLLTRGRRVTLLAILALGLLAAPLWVPATDLGEPTFTYERAEVVVGEEGITYANESYSTFSMAISDEIACTGGLHDYRACAFERHLQTNGTIPSGWYASNPDAPFYDGRGAYRFVQLDGSSFETVSVVNTSVRNDQGGYRIDLALEPVSHTEALESVSRDVDAEGADLPAVVTEAAREGTARSRREVDVPPQLIAVNDRYYRVYRADHSEPGPIVGVLSAVVVFGGPLVGVGYLLRLRRMVELRLVDEGTRSGRNVPENDRSR